SEAEMEFLMEVIRGIRNMRGEMNIHPGRSVRCVAIAVPEHGALLQSYRSYVENLANCDPLEITGPGQSKPKQALSTVVRGTEIYLPLAGLVDLDKELARLEKEAKTIDGVLQRVQKKLSNEQFLAKAPPEVVEKEREREAELRRTKEALNRRLAALKS
ncbi:MAG: Valine--tRNA ligase, partial [Thermacetogenium phaeum]